jgi:hypothetical protein
VEQPQKEEVKIEEPHDLKSGTTQNEEVKTEEPHDLRSGTT